MPLSTMPVPQNMKVAGGGTMTFVEGDVYNIAQRLQQVDPSLFLYLHEGSPKPWVVVEKCADGVERFVKRYEELGGHIIEDLRYMLAVPFEQRMKRLEAEADAVNEQLGRMSDEQFEKYADDFLRAGRKSGLLDPNWFTSYRPKVRG